MESMAGTNVEERSIRLNSSVSAILSGTSEVHVQAANTSSTSHSGWDDDHDQHLFPLVTDCCVQIVVFTVMVSACSVLGTAGNIPVLLVYCTKSERRTSNTFIKVLAIIDLVVCVIIMPYTVVLELHLVTSDIVCRMFEFVRHLSVTASNLTLVAIAVERYVAVCVIGHRLTIGNVHQGMVAVMVVSILIAVPSMGIFATVKKEDVQEVMCAYPHAFEDEFTFCHFTTTVFGPVLSTAYQVVLMALFFVTFLVIVLLYAVVYTSLWKRAKRRSIVQSLRDVDLSSNGGGASGRRRTREVSLPEVREPQPQEDQELYRGESEGPEFSSHEQVIRLAASTELTRCWSRHREELASMSASSSSSSTATASVRHRLPMHRRTARMLFLCSVVFLVTWLPFWVDVFSNSHNLCLRYLFFVGNASNPLVYGVANSHFRRAFFKLIVSYKPKWDLCKRK